MYTRIYIENGAILALRRPPTKCGAVWLLLAKRQGQVGQREYYILYKMFLKQCCLKGL